MFNNVFLILGTIACLAYSELRSVEIIKQEEMAEGHTLTKIKFDNHTYIYFVPNVDNNPANKPAIFPNIGTFMHDPGCTCHYNPNKGRKR